MMTLEEFSDRILKPRLRQLSAEQLSEASLKELADLLPPKGPERPLLEKVQNAWDEAIYRCVRAIAALEGQEDDLY